MNRSDVAWYAPVYFGAAVLVAGLVVACTSKAAEPSPCTYMGDHMHRCVFPDAVCYESVYGLSCRFDPPSR